MSGTCAECSQKRLLGKPLQARLRINEPGDPYEQEADRVAEQVMRMPDTEATRPCGEGGSPIVQRRATSGGTGVMEAPSIVHDVLNSSGQPLDASIRAFFGSRFGHDFSRVRVHADGKADKSARAVNAHAYTVGPNIVFGARQFSHETREGRRLLAHELAHVVQQSGSEPLLRDRGGSRSRPSLLSTPCIQRDGMGDVRLAEARDELEEQIRTTPAFVALDPDSVKLTEEIIIEIRKRSLPDTYHFLSKLKVLFDTPLKPPAVITTETQAGTATAVKAEKTRLAKPAAARNTTREEKAAADPKRTWVPIAGKFGGGTYYVDRTSATNIVVRADIHLIAKGTGTKKDVDSIKAMEDGIEKAASNKGYWVDIRFVDTAAANTFQVDVDPSQWEVATNWSGGDPVGFAHELHHMFAFDLDRYDYTQHASNESMPIPDRLHWFREELKKPANYNDPTSIMNSASHPNDDDACRVAGLDVAVCVPARVAARAAGKL
ncbi:MAG: DUF4157 domain-containing protein [Nitrospiraceae bacterium]